MQVVNGRIRGILKPEPIVSERLTRGKTGLAAHDPTGVSTCHRMILGRSGLLISGF